jgi:hypothetical protein
MPVERFAIALALTCGLVCAPRARAADASAEQTVGGIEAVVFVCTSIDPKSAKTGGDMLKALMARDKLDLAAIRKTEGYRSIYNSEVNRLLLLPVKDRLAACRNAW